MFFYVQAALAFLGIVIVLRGRFRIGQQVVTRPIAPMVGAMLAAPIPVCLWLGIVTGVSAAVGPTANQEGTPSLEQRIESIQWLDPLITAGFVAVAAVLTAVGRQDEDGRLSFPTAPANLADAQEKWAPAEPGAPSDQVTAVPRTAPQPVETEASVRPFTPSPDSQPQA
jgi:hypothetical protein